MIVLAPKRDGRIVEIRVEGIQGLATFGAFAHRLADLHDSDRLLRVFLDWTRLKGWKPGADLRRSFARWDEAARAIDRAAIVHRACWNRHAALLGAVLRTNGCIVRSWTQAETGQALQWLVSDEAVPPRPAGFNGCV